MTLKDLSLPLEGTVVEAVRAVLHAPARRRGPAALLVPGAGGNLDGDGLVALAEVLAGAGLPVVRANLPHHELGRRAPKAQYSLAAYRQILAGARQVVGGDRPWILGGKSYGGRVASMAVADGVRAAGLLFYGYPLHPPGKPERLRVEHWPLVGAPCLFLQGDRDAFCGLDLLHANLAKLPRRSTLHVVEGADHSLRITGKASPTGLPSSAPDTIRALDRVVRSWVRSLDR